MLNLILICQFITNIHIRLHVTPTHTDGHRPPASCADPEEAIIIANQA